jgi:hypothetical protein
MPHPSRLAAVQAQEDMPPGTDRTKHLETLVGEIPDDVRAYTIPLGLRLRVSRRKINGIVKSGGPFDHLLSLRQHLIPSWLLQPEIGAHILLPHLNCRVSIAGCGQLLVYPERRLLAQRLGEMIRGERPVLVVPEMVASRQPK